MTKAHSESISERHSSTVSGETPFSSVLGRSVRVDESRWTIDMAHPESKTLSRSIDRIGRNPVDYSAEMAATAFFTQSKSIIMSTALQVHWHHVSGHEHESARMSRSRPLSLPDIVKYCGLYPDDIMDLFAMYAFQFHLYFAVHSLISHLDFSRGLTWEISSYLFREIILNLNLHCSRFSPFSTQSYTHQLDSSGRLLFSLQSVSGISILELLDLTLSF